MTLRNRKLVRKPIGMLRVNEEEQPDFDFAVEYFNGEEAAVAYRLAIREWAQMKRHERNSLSPSRIHQSVDRNAFGGLLAA